MFDQAAVVGRPSTLKLPIETSSPKARGMTDRLSLLIGAPEMLVRVMRSMALIVPFV